MQNIAARIEVLEQNLAALSGKLAQATPDFIASAVYLPSSEDPDRIFALAHYGGDEEHYIRADREVWRRRLSPEDSIAAELYTSPQPTTAASRMFPAEHICAHIPLNGQSGQTGLLQAVFRKHKGLKNADRLLTIDQTIIEKTGKSLNGLLAGGKPNDRALNVRPPYKPDSVVIYCDVSGFVKAAEMANYRAQDYADRFCKDFIGKTANNYQVQILRYEGDGIWLSLPFDPDVAGSATQAAHKAGQMAKDIAQDYKGFARSTDKRFENTNIKIMMELAELRTMSMPASNVTDISGPCFTAITDNLVHARRDRNHVMIGPELAQLMPARSLINATPYSRYADFIL